MKKSNQTKRKKQRKTRARTRARKRTIQQKSIHEKYKGGGGKNIQKKIYDLLCKVLMKDCKNIPTFEKIQSERLTAKRLVEIIQNMESREVFSLEAAKKAAEIITGKSKKEILKICSTSIIKVLKARGQLMRTLKKIREINRESQSSRSSRTSKRSKSSRSSRTSKRSSQDGGGAGVGGISLAAVVMAIGMTSFFVFIACYVVYILFKEYRQGNDDVVSFDYPQRRTTGVPRVAREIAKSTLDTIDLDEDVETGLCAICLESIGIKPGSDEENAIKSSSMKQKQATVERDGRDWGDTDIREAEVEFDAEQKIVRTKCGHTFHKNCINMWIDRGPVRPECPSCRGSMVTDASATEEASLPSSVAP